MKVLIQNYKKSLPRIKGTVMRWSENPYTYAVGIQI